MTVKLARSYLYVPGDRPDLLEKADGSGADAVIGDLEDAVRPAGKSQARAGVRAWLAGGVRAASAEPAAARGPQRWVRVNAGTLTEDLEAVVGPGLTGVMVPKASVAAMTAAHEALSELEQKRGIASRTVMIIPLIESAAGLLDARTIASLPRVQRLAAGEVDLAADLGIVLDGAVEHLRPIRLQLVVASAAAEIARPIGPTSTAFRDLDAFRAGATELYRLGFRARTAIHPAQLPVIHDVFTPSAAELAAAADLVARFETAGGGGALDANGNFIDGAGVRHARELIASVPPDTG